MLAQARTSPITELQACPTERTPAGAAEVHEAQDEAPEAQAVWPELEACVAQAQAAWPELAPLGPRFAEFLASRVARNAPPAQPATSPGHPTAGHQGLASLCHVDLYLACACLHGDQAAVAILLRRYQADVDAVLRHLGAGGLADEIKGTMLADLLVAEPGKQPTIARYGGRGNLRRWLRSVAVRAALKAMARGNKEVSLDEQQHDVAAPAGELQAFEARYAAALGQALRTAMESLPRRERVLLRQHYLDGLGIDHLAAMYQVHRSTAARWLVAIRTRVREQTRIALAQTLPVGAGELTSLVQQLQHQIEVSLAHVLGAAA